MGESVESQEEHAPTGLLHAARSVLVQSVQFWRDPLARVIALVRRGQTGHASEDGDIAALWHAGDWDRLAIRSPVVEPFCGAPLDAPWIRVTLARARQDDMPGAELALAIYRDQNPEDEHFLGAIVQYCLEQGLTRQAVALFRSVERVSPHWPELQAARDAIAPHHPKVETPAHPAPASDARSQPLSATHAKTLADWMQYLVRHRYQAPEHRPPGEQLVRLEHALQAAMNGRVSTALSGLRQSTQDSWDSDASDRIGEAIRLFEHIQTCPGPVRASVRESQADWILSEPAGTGRVAIVLTGLENRIGGWPISVFDLLLARSGFQALYLRDLSRCAYTCGVRSLGRTAKETTASLRRMLKGINTRHLLFIGVSGGGYAALRYGITLQADRVMALGGGTVARPEDKASIGDHRVPVIARLTAKRATRDDFTAPVHTILPGCKRPPRIDLFFGAHSPEDRAHAELLAGFPSVTLHALSGFKRHDITTEVFTRGHLLAPAGQAEGIA